MKYVGYLSGPYTEPFNMYTLTHTLTTLEDHTHTYCPSLTHTHRQTCVPKTQNSMAIMWQYFVLQVNTAIPVTVSHDAIEPTTIVPVNCGLYALVDHILPSFANNTQLCWVKYTLCIQWWQCSIYVYTWHIVAVGFE